MRIQRVSSETIQTPKPFARQLPPQILERATDGLCWVSLISAVSSVTLTLIHQSAARIRGGVDASRRCAWQSCASSSFRWVSSWCSARAGSANSGCSIWAWSFRSLMAFACGLFEGAAYQDPNAVVLGHSGIAVWMMLCGRLMPNAPLKSAITAILCVLMWPLGYWVDLQIYGYQPMPFDPHAGRGCCRWRSWRSGCTFSTAASSRCACSSSGPKTWAATCSPIASAGAGWAKSGARGTRRWRATRPSSSSVPRCCTSSTGRQERLLRQALRARGAGYGQPALAAHRGALRFRPGQGWILLLRDGTAGGNRPADAGGALRPHGARPRGPHSPARFRNRSKKRTARDWCIATSSRATSCSASSGCNTISPRSWTSAWSRRRTIDDPERTADHHGRRHHRHARLSLARSGDGQPGDRWPRGPLQSRLHGVFPAHRPNGLRRAHAHGLRHRPRASAAGPDPASAPSCPFPPGWKRS